MRNGSRCLIDLGVLVKVEKLPTSQILFKFLYIFFKIQLKKQDSTAKKFFHLNSWKI